MRKYHRKCVRCAVSFLGTKAMLVCGYCYGTQEDLELADFINAYPSVEFAPSLDKIEKIIAQIENNTCFNHENLS